MNHTLSEVSQERENILSEVKRISQALEQVFSNPKSADYLALQSGLAQLKTQYVQATDELIEQTTLLENVTEEKALPEEPQLLIKTLKAEIAVKQAENDALEQAIQQLKQEKASRQLLHDNQDVSGSFLKEKAEIADLFIGLMNKRNEEWIEKKKKHSEI